MLPTFLGIGFAKCGTTTLHEILKQHPDIYLPEQKELHYFNQEGLKHRVSSLSHYELTYFANANHQIAGEISPSYIAHPSARDNIKTYFGDDMKFIVCLRDPVDQIVSAYKHLSKELKFFGSFEDFLQSLPSRLGYYQKVSYFMEVFPKENFFFFNADEELFTNTENHIQSCFSFLGVRSVSDLNCDVHANEFSSRYFVKLIEKETWIGRNLFSNVSLNRAVNKALRFKARRWGHAKRGMVHAFSDYTTQDALVVKPSKQLLSDAAKRKDDVSLSSDEKSRLFGSHFYHEVCKLENLIEKDLSSWKRKYGYAD